MWTDVPTSSRFRPVSVSSGFGLDAAMLERLRAHCAFRAASYRTEHCTTCVSSRLHHRVTYKRVIA